MPLSIMTPSFYYNFEILKRAIDAFNARCSCEKITVSVSFTQIHTTDDSDLVRGFQVVDWNL